MYIIRNRGCFNSIDIERLEGKGFSVSSSVCVGRYVLRGEDEEERMKLL